MSAQLGGCPEKGPAQNRRLTKELQKDQKRHDSRGTAVVKCKICLTWEGRLGNLLSHVKKNHPSEWQ